VKDRKVKLTGGTIIRSVLLGIVFVSFTCFSRSDAASFQGLGFIPGGTFSWAYDVSINGLVVVGYSQSISSNREAFRWTASGGMQGLGFLPGGGRSIAEGVSADGSVVVGYSWTGIDMQAFRWTEEDGMVGLGDLPGGDFWSEAFAVSADGSVVVGISKSASGTEVFRWTESGGMEALGFLPGGQFNSIATDVSDDGSVVVGQSDEQAFRWTESSGMVGIGGYKAESVSADGSVVVGYTSTQAFRWTVSGGMQLLGSLPGGDWSDAKAVSPDGSIVVGSARKDDNWQPIIWDATNGMRSIKDILEDDYGLDLTGWNLTWAYGISAGGSTIVGYAEYPNNEGWIVSFDSPVTVPDVVGMSQTDAESAIAFANLSVGNITRQLSDTVPEGHVINQEPTGGSEVFINSAVNLVISLGQGDIIYVDADANGANDGTRWQDAYNHLQDAIAEANSRIDVNQIWVAEGIYKPDSNSADPNGSGNRIATFGLINGVVIKGGYAGFGEPDPNARDIVVYETILSGDLNDNDVGELEDPSRNENSYHVVTGSQTDPNAVLDGFTITAGKANGVRSGTDGAGMYNYQGSPTLIDCTFSANLAVRNGAGMHNSYGSPVVINCVFMNNSAGNRGGGIYCYWSDAMLTNCIFSGNLAPYGGGMRIYSSDSVLTNCTFSGNSATLGGGVYNYGGNPTLTNCILWGDTPGEIYVSSGTPVVTYSDVQGGWPGLGNIDADPCFVEPGKWVDVNDPNIIVEPNDPNAVWIDGDYHLKSQGWYWHTGRKVWTWDEDETSRCIDEGNPGSPLGEELLTIPEDPDNDFGQNLRINMGAYGGTAEASMPPYDWALLSDITNDGTVDFVDFAHLADIYLEHDEQLPADFDRDGDVDKADLRLLAEDWLKQTSWPR